MMGGCRAGVGLAGFGRMGGAADCAPQGAIGVPGHKRRQGAAAGSCGFAGGLTFDMNRISSPAAARVAAGWTEP